MNRKCSVICLAALLAVSIAPVSVMADDTVRMYRLYNSNSGEHFYTASLKERNQLIGYGWRDEGTGWIAPKETDYPVYRLYNPNSGDHHYTLSEKERDQLDAIGWNYEGIGWYSADSETGMPVYRQFNPNAKTGTHNYSVSKDENDSLVKRGWKAEGIGWYSVPFNLNDDTSTVIPTTAVLTVNDGSDPYTVSYSPDTASKTLTIDTGDSLDPILLLPLVSPDDIGRAQLLTASIACYDGPNQYCLFPYMKRVQSGQIETIVLKRTWEDYTYHFTVNAKHQVTAVTESAGSDSAVSKTTYTYDQKGHLTAIQNTSTDMNIRASYNRAGNITSYHQKYSVDYADFALNGISILTQRSTTENAKYTSSLFYDEDDHLTTIQKDVTDSAYTSGTCSLSYAENRLSGVSDRTYWTTDGVDSDITASAEFHYEDE